MTRRVLLIDHPVGQRDDRASQILRDSGYQVDWCSPGRGDPLPEINGHHEAVIVFGGTENLSQDADLDYLKAEVDWINRWVADDRPYLGICLGGQLLAHALGARVAPHDEGWHEIGYVKIEPTPLGARHGFLSEPLHVYHWHGEGFALPEGAEALAVGPRFENQAFRYGERAFGLQFHPEVTLEVIGRWMTDASESLKRPGAHQAERQIADAKRHQPALEAWFDQFLARWLD